MNRNRRLARRHAMWMQLYRKQQELEEKYRKEKGSYSLKEHLQENPGQYL